MLRFFRSSAALWQEVTLLHRAQKVTLVDITKYTELLEAARKMNLLEPSFVSLNKEFDLIQVVDDKSLDMCLKLALPHSLMLNVKGRTPLHKTDFVAATTNPDLEAALLNPDSGTASPKPDFEAEHVSFMYSQANGQMEAGNFEKASETYTQCIDRLIGKPDKLGDVLACKAGLAQCLLHLDKAEESRRLLEEILQQYSEAGFPKDSRHKYLKLFLAETQLRQSKFREAMETYEELEASLRDNPEAPYARVCRDLGDLYASQGHIQEAAQVLNRGLTYSSSQEERSLQTANLTALLGIVESIRQNYGVAEKRIGEAVSIVTEKLGPDSIDSIELNYRLAANIARQGRLEEAKQLFETLLERYRSKQYPSNSMLSNFLLGYAEVLYILALMPEARKAAQEVIEIEAGNEQSRYLAEARNCVEEIDKIDASKD